MQRMTRTLLLALILLISSNTLSAQKIKQPKAYDTQIGAMVSMLEDLKTRITQRVRLVNREGTDFLLDENANRIGAMILHLAAIEAYYQVYTFEDRSFNEEEMAKWGLALELGEEAREKLVGKPITYYLNIWSDVRKETLRQLKTKDDQWFKAKTKLSNMDNHWAWFHVMEHQANHMGQIAMIKKRIPKK
ncbi:MAG: DinB family protein [Saprospiraceae bacterium]